MIVEVRSSQAEKDHIHTVRKLFHLTDVDNDGFVSLEEFVLMGLHQKKLHTKKPMTWKDEERIKNGLVRRFREIDSNFQAVPYYKYKEYMLRSVGEMHPGDLEAQSATLNSALMDATIANGRIMVNQVLHDVYHGPSLPTLLTSDPEDKGSYKKL
eukprot:Skav221622  [mRNA]  locus=scaffold2664:54783:56353:+ [translate_table: standard]